MSDSPKAAEIRRRSKIGVGFPQMTELEAWSTLVYKAFGAMPYLVGSALEGKDWRDVDVRVMLSDDEWRRLFGDTLDIHPRRMIAPWAVICTALSIWGQQWTGLPIDFQFQTITEGNGDPTHGSRNALGLGFYDVDIERAP